MNKGKQTNFWQKKSDEGKGHKSRTQKEKRRRKKAEKTKPMRSMRLRWAFLVGVVGLYLTLMGTLCELPAPLLMQQVLRYVLLCLRKNLFWLNIREIDYKMYCKMCTNVNEEHD